jgi:hypothetical protein
MAASLPFFSIDDAHELAPRMKITLHRRAMYRKDSEDEVTISSVVAGTPGHCFFSRGA